jgi:hypothetical protein
LDVFAAPPPNRKPQWAAPDQFFARGTALPLRGSAARGSLRSSSLRLTPEGQGGMNEEQFTEKIHTDVDPRL